MVELIPNTNSVKGICEKVYELSKRKTVGMEEERKKKKKKRVREIE